MPTRRAAVLPFVAIAVLVAACAWVIGWLRPRLTELLAEGESGRKDLYILPNPDRLAVMSLGYRAALADLLWGHVRVWSGIAFVEKRRLTHGGEYLDTINALDPKFRDPYVGADTMLTFQAVPTPKEDYHKAREILERGVENRPDDAGLWLQLGQFVGAVAPAHLADLESEEVALAWEADGARYVARACELGASDPSITRFCLLATHLYSKLGKEQALEAFLERVLTLSDSPETREEALNVLAGIRGKRTRTEARERYETLRATQESDLPFVSRALYTALAPPFETWECSGLPAGSDRTDAADCATRWGPFLEERGLEERGLDEGASESGRSPEPAEPAEPSRVPDRP